MVARESHMVRSCMQPRGRLGVGLALRMPSPAGHVAEQESCCGQRGDAPARQGGVPQEGRLHARGAAAGMGRWRQGRQHGRVSLARQGQRGFKATAMAAAGTGHETTSRQA
jgi:hypothetical protein